MCGFYDDEQKIKKGDIATLNNEYITILSAKHIKYNKTMDITYHINNEEKVFNIPYQTTGHGFKLINRAD